MEFLSIAKQRFSVRSYTSQHVEPEKLEKILEAARVAPTVANLQPLRLIVAQSEQSLAKIGKAANIYGAPLAIIVCADHEKAWVRPFDKKQTGDIDASILTDHMMPVSYTHLDVYKRQLLRILTPVSVLVWLSLKSRL